MTSNIRPILLVEDDVNDVELVTAALKSGNLANPVIVARDGVEAVEILSKSRYDGLDANGPVVVLLDNKMPRMTGLELLRHMKNDERFKRIPVVMMTSSRAEPDLEQAYALGVNAYVVKPVDFKDFTDAVKIVGRFWAILNEPPIVSGMETGMDR
ncbi:MAG TPA: response regulator [Candidatus Acidoferrum sp.]|nr:response regulator [Candidatus Acidoferrum sp.]